ncbi:MAG: hypothetical protein HRT98_02455 [Mycoplasmatales bacterium]|nr:hypothetical protein [Mycoplasmatales bacterium]
MKNKDILVGNGAFIKNNPGFKLAKYKEELLKQWGRFTTGEIEGVTTDGKNFDYVNTMINMFIEEMDRTNSFDIEKNILIPYVWLQMNKNSIDMIWNRTLDIWMLFSTVVVSPFCIGVKKYNKEIKQKLESYENIFTTNYQFNNVKNVHFLHGRFFKSQDNINYSIILIPSIKDKSKFVDETIKVIDEEIKQRKEKIKIHGKAWIEMLGDLPEKYNEYAFLNLNDASFYLKNSFEIIETKNEEISIFGFSYQGDSALINKIKEHYKVINIVSYNKNDKSEYIKKFKTDSNIVNFIKFEEL